MEEKQRVRIERVGIAVSGSLLMSAMALGMAWAGYFPMHAAVIYAAVTAAICAVFYALIRSGRNLRFADPNLSAAQLVSAALTISYAVYESGDARPVFLAVYLLAYAFGAFALRPRALVFVALFYLACHAAVIGLLLLLRPAVTDLRYELVQFFVFLVMMGWTSYVAIYVSRLRRESRRSTAALKSETDERLKVASARQLADARYRELFESVVDGMIISQPDGLILDANQAICRRFGYHREELIGRNVRDLVDPQELAAHPMREDMTRKWGRRERKLLARDGGNTPTEVVAGPMPDGNVLSILRDITERKLAEEDQLRFRMAMDASADMILLVDRETMRFVDANSTICRLLGYSREELLALPPEQILPVSRAELEEAYDRQIADPSTPGGLTSYYLCKDGSRLPFESKRQVLRIGGRYVISISSRDIRERLQAENALRESERRLRANRRLLEIVIDAIPMSIFVKDTNSNYVMVNNYMTEFFETSKETMTSLHTSKLPTHEATRLQSIEDDQRVYRDRKTFTHETLIQRPDGSPVPFHSSKIPLFDDADCWASTATSPRSSARANRSSASTSNSKSVSKRAPASCVPR